MNLFGHKTDDVKVGKQTMKEARVVIAREGKKVNHWTRLACQAEFQSSGVKQKQ